MAAQLEMNPSQKVWEQWNSRIFSKSLVAKMQGYLLSRPIPVAEFKPFMIDRKL